MNYARIVIFSLLAILGGWICYMNISVAFLKSSQVIIERDGIMNILSGYACFFVGIYITVYAVKEQFHLTINIGEINKAIGGITILSLILSVITFSAINRQVDGYTECKNQREISSRYSSRTYAISPEACNSLKKK